MKEIIIFVVLALSSLNGYSQVEKFETDSTVIECSRNSVYKIWEESYKGKDSLFRSVRYIKDTTQLCIEGWQTRNGQCFGKWSEYKIDGTWLYTIDYANHSWTYNKDEFKFQAVKDSMKAKADEILIDKFGRAFFDQNIVFRFYGRTSIRTWDEYETGMSYRNEKHLGSWIEPINQKPNCYVLNYTIKLSNKELYHDKLEIRLNSRRELRTEASIIINEKVFDDIVVPRKAPFSISKEKAIEIATNNLIRKSNEVFQASLKFDKMQSGEFYYELIQQYDEFVEGDCPQNCTTTVFFNVWRFDPWTSELIFKQAMKRNFRRHKGCVSSGLYRELDD